MIISGRDFIVFSDDWGRHPFSCQHIMQHFLPRNRILWVNTIGMRNPSLTAYDIKRSFEKIWGWLKQREKDEVQPVENLTVINPVMTPYNNISFVRSCNRSRVVRAVKQKMALLKFRDPIVITTLPNAADYVGDLGESFSVYYCVDDFTHWPGVDGQLVTEMEEALLQKVDLVCASSEELCRKKSRLGNKLALLAHGVDFDHFQVEPVKKRSENRPVVGFFGALSSWLDFGLLEQLARMRPDLDFVFIGPADTDISSLEKFDNVRLAGRIHYHELPEAAADFDVAIIPFSITEMTRSVNPLKLMEYLACGLPVVSTPLPEVKKFADNIYLADSAEEFSSAIDLALAEDSTARQKKRRELARQFSWEKVAGILSSLIEENLIHKGRVET
jgi:glycosyltransferase involved in cell wall biosynthesis